MPTMPHISLPVLYSEAWFFPPSRSGRCWGTPRPPAEGSFRTPLGRYCGPPGVAGSSPPRRRLEPAHHGAQLFADLLDAVLALAAAHGVEGGAAGLVLEDPFAGEGA